MNRAMSVLSSNSFASSGPSGDQVRASQVAHPAEKINLQIRAVDCNGPMRRVSYYNCVRARIAALARIVWWSRGSIVHRRLGANRLKTRCHRWNCCRALSSLIWRKMDSSVRNQSARSTTVDRNRQCLNNDNMNKKGRFYERESV